MCVAVSCFPSQISKYILHFMGVRIFSSVCYFLRL